MARRTVRRDRRNQQHGYPWEQRFRRNPEVADAIRRAEHALLYGETVELAIPT